MIGEDTTATTAQGEPNNRVSFAVQEGQRTCHTGLLPSLSTSTSFISTVSVDGSRTVTLLPTMSPPRRAPLMPPTTGRMTGAASSSHPPRAAQLPTTRSCRPGGGADAQSSTSYTPASIALAVSAAMWAASSTAAASACTHTITPCTPSHVCMRPLCQFRDVHGSVGLSSCRTARRPVPTRRGATPCTLAVGTGNAAVLHAARPPRRVMQRQRGC